MSLHDPGDGPEALPGRMSPLERAKLPMNDLGNARRVYEAALVAGACELLWLADGAGGKGCWVAFDGVRWSADEGPSRALAFAHRAAVAIAEEVQALRDAEPEELSAVFGPKFTREMADERCGHLFGWAIKSGDSAKSSAMLGQFKGLRDGVDGPFLTQAWLREFDSAPLSYHCANGTIRFAQELAADGSGRLEWLVRFEQGHRAADRFMQVASVAYEAGADAPNWFARMETMHRDPVQRSAIRRIYGMGLTALITDQAFYIFQGKGQDGKSLTNDVICKLHGLYARKSDPKTFLEGPTQASSAHQSDIVRLAGDIRLVVLDEPKKGSTWDGQRIKQATGSELIARGAHGVTELSFKPHWQLIAECNALPKPPSDDRGFRRRFKLYPWVVQFGITPGVPDEPFDVVEARLLGEASGILNWMIGGCLEWLEERTVPEPDLAKRASASFWATTSALGEFIESCCDLSDPDAREPATPLYQAFRQFCLDRGDKEDRIMSQTAFGTNLNNAQIYAAENNATGKKDRVGIRLKSSARLPEAPPDDGFPTGGSGDWVPDNDPAPDWLDR